MSRALRVWGLGFIVWGLGFRSLGFRAQGLKTRADSYNFDSRQHVSKVRTSLRVVNISDGILLWPFMCLA